jgi:hypothetical protein
MAAVMREDRYQERRSDYDVTDTVKVSSPVAVRTAVNEIFAELYPHASFDPVLMGFIDFERFYAGFDAAYHGVDTAYHDIQHTLDMTLALTRLVAGYERVHGEGDRLGAERARLAIITALFHDAGYLRHRDRDRGAVNGAEFTLKHVSRSAGFLGEYLPTIGLSADVPVAKQIVHFTGYELSLDSIELDCPQDATIGHLLGTADLIAQMADRCYLEKCRDRLFAEFVLAGIAIDEAGGDTLVRYRSGKDLLAKTLTFYEQSARDRLDRSFNRAYRYLEAYFDTENPYVVFVTKNLDHLGRIIHEDAWDLLRRRPPCVVPDPDAESRLKTLALRRIDALARESKITLTGNHRLLPVLGS